MMAVTVHDITKQYLEDNGYDGLRNEECGCELSDLAPCYDGVQGDCGAGYKVPCPGPEDCHLDGDCNWHISPNKPEVTND